MSAESSLSPTQFQHTLIGSTHNIQAWRGEDRVGNMSWRSDTGKITHISTDPDHQRTGVATGMWTAAQALSSLGEVKEPKHSPVRSEAGNAWAKSVSQKLPRRVYER